MDDSIIYFPHPSQTTAEGILAVGGNLSSESLKLAYRWGIFPWFNPNDPIVWWSPDPRFVIYPNKVKVAKSMRPYFNQNKFRVSFDTHFEEVIEMCQKIKRKEQAGTWITEEMKAAYIQLYNEGVCHSVEVWENKELVGGLYGVAIGKVFSGESMFSLKSNASKFGFIACAKKLEQMGFWIIDCQQPNPFLESLGGKEMSRTEYLKLLRKNLFEDPNFGKWE